MTVDDYYNFFKLFCFLKMGARSSYSTPSLPTLSSKKRFSAHFSQFTEEEHEIEQEVVQEDSPNQTKVNKNDEKERSLRLRDTENEFERILSEYKHAGRKSNSVDPLVQLTAEVQQKFEVDSN